MASEDDDDRRLIDENRKPPPTSRRSLNVSEEFRINNKDKEKLVDDEEEGQRAITTTSNSSTPRSVTVAADTNKKNNSRIVFPSNPRKGKSSPSSRSSLSSSSSSMLLSPTSKKDPPARIRLADLCGRTTTTASITATSYEDDDDDDGEIGTEIPSLQDPPTSSCDTATSQEDDSNSSSLFSYIKACKVGLDPPTAFDERDYLVRATAMNNSTPRQLYFGHSIARAGGIGGFYSGSTAATSHDPPGRNHNTMTNHKTRAYVPMRSYSSYHGGNMIIPSADPPGCSAGELENTNNNTKKNTMMAPQNGSIYGCGGLLERSTKETMSTTDVEGDEEDDDDDDDDDSLIGETFITLSSVIGEEPHGLQCTGHDSCRLSDFASFQDNDNINNAQQQQQQQHVVQQITPTDREDSLQTVSVLTEEAADPALFRADLVQRELRRLFFSSTPRSSYWQHYNNSGHRQEGFHPFFQETVGSALTTEERHSSGVTQTTSPRPTSNSNTSKAQEPEQTTGTAQTGEGERLQVSSEQERQAVLSEQHQPDHSCQLSVEHHHQPTHSDAAIQADVVDRADPPQKSSVQVDGRSMSSAGYILEQQEGHPRDQLSIIHENDHNEDLDISLQIESRVDCDTVECDLEGQDERREDLNDGSDFRTNSNPGQFDKWHIVDTALASGVRVGEGKSDVIVDYDPEQQKQENQPMQRQQPLQRGCMASEDTATFHMSDGQPQIKNQGQIIVVQDASARSPRKGSVDRWKPVVRSEFNPARWYLDQRQPMYLPEKIKNEPFVVHDTNYHDPKQGQIIIVQDEQPKNSETRSMEDYTKQLPEHYYCYHDVDHQADDVVVDSDDKSENNGTVLVVAEVVNVEDDNDNYVDDDSSTGIQNNPSGITHLKDEIIDLRQQQREFLASLIDLVDKKLAISP